MLNCCIYDTQLSLWQNLRRSSVQIKIVQFYKSSVEIIWEKQVKLEKYHLHERILGTGIIKLWRPKWDYRFQKLENHRFKFLYIVHFLIWTHKINYKK